MSLSSSTVDFAVSTPSPAGFVPQRGALPDSGAGAEFDAHMAALDAAQADAYSAALPAWRHQPSPLNDALGATQSRLNDSFMPALPQGFAGLPVLTQIELASEMQRRVTMAEAVLSLTRGVANGVQKAGESILNKQS